MILVKFDDNYGDEFDTNGFRIMTQKEFDNYLAGAREDFIQAAATEHSWYGTEVERYFGTNEGWRWCDYEDFMHSISCEQIDKYTKRTLERLFPGCAKWYSYGMFPNMGEY